MKSPKLFLKSLLPMSFLTSAKLNRAVKAVRAEMSEMF